LVDLLHGQRSAVHVAALDDESLVVLREVLQSLRSVHRFALDERDGGRTDEQVVETLDARLRGGTLDQGVLGDGVGGTLSESATQLGQTSHRQTTVFRDHGSGGGLELLGDLRNCGNLLGLCHTSPPLSNSRFPGVPSGTPHRTTAGTGKRRTPRRRAHGAYKEEELECTRKAHRGSYLP